MYSTWTRASIRPGSTTILTMTFDRNWAKNKIIKGMQQRKRGQYLDRLNGYNIRRCYETATLNWPV